MIRRTLIGCVAGGLTLAGVLTPAVPQAQRQRSGGLIADRQWQVHRLVQQAANLSGAGRFVDMGLVVVDTQTNLVWEKKMTEVGSGGNAGDLHDVDNMYDWCEATGNSEGPRCNGNETSWIGQVNAAAFAGFTNWRVPTREELLSIVDTSVATCRSGAPCIDPILGPTQASEYWSSTEVSPNVAWIVIFSSGNLKFGTKIDRVLVRAVRNGP
jgi:uncharacterized protein DUF1566